MRIEKKVWDIMTKDVVSIEMVETVGKAAERMRERNLKKILLLDGGVPKGVLEDWMAEKMDPNKPIGEALKELGVEPPPVKPVPPNLAVREAEAFLDSVSTLVVVEDLRNLKGISGIVTSSDLYKARPKLS